MWNEIADICGLADFMNTFSSFHDSCIKEIKYLSGAYVDKKLDMYPVNDRRVLNIIIQRQFEDYPMIEMEFLGLKFLKLFPIDEQYTSEIIEATMVYKNDLIYWYDSGELSEEELDKYEGTIICASGFRWRSLEGHMDQKTLYSLTE